MLTCEKQRIFIRGWATGLNKENLLKGLEFIEEYHDGQFRKGDGSPYYSHPIKVVSHAISLGWHDDDDLTGLLLHDVVEDTALTFGDIYQMFGERVEQALHLYTNDQPTETIYYGYLMSSAARGEFPPIGKLLDRCHNVSTMYNAFTMQKMLSYLDETQDYIYPLLRAVRKARPEDRERLFVVKYHLESLDETIRGIFKSMEE